MAQLRIFDDLKRELVFARAPERIVSLVPSDTLTIAALGCGGRLVGRTDYCELPPEVAALPAVGGTKNPKIDAILALSPDLVVANQEENTRGDLEKLAQANIRVFIAFPKRVADGIAHMARLARILDVARDPGAMSLVKEGYENLRAADAARASLRPVPTFCPIWMKPLMTIHGATFISDMLALCGAENVFAGRERRYPLAADLGASERRVEAAGRDTRYPRITLDEVVERRPELILLPSEPHPFSEDDATTFRALDTPASARDAVAFVDGKDICWYGARSVDGIQRLRAAIDRYR